MLSPRASVRVPPQWSLRESYLFISRYTSPRRGISSVCATRYSACTSVLPRKDASIQCYNRGDDLLIPPVFVRRKHTRAGGDASIPVFRSGANVAHLGHHTRAESVRLHGYPFLGDPASIDYDCRLPPPVFQLQQRRHFRNYFTAILPGSSLHPDPTFRKDKNFPDRETTTVRIPLRSAKHHFGAYSARGTRAHNEDAYQAGVIEIPPFSEPSKNQHPGAAGSIPEQDPSVFYYGIFDGHGGDQASIWLRDQAHRYIEESTALFNPQKLAIPVTTPESQLPAEGREDRKNLQDTLIKSWRDTVGGYFRRFKPDFGITKRCNTSGSPTIASILVYSLLKLDYDFITNTKPWFEPSPPEEESNTLLGAKDSGVTSFKGGSTATIVLISSSSPAQPYWNPDQSSTIVTAHLGDTRALLCRTSDGMAVPLTTPHSPSSPTEAARLRRYAAAFAQDSFGEERFGFLANTRSVGDVGQKRLGVSAEPDLTVTSLGPSEYAFLVLMSDGISAVLGDQEIVDIVKEANTPQEAAKELADFVDEVGDVGDNATALVVRLGGWEKRGGREGASGTVQLRMWRREEAVERAGRGRMM